MQKLSTHIIWYDAWKISLHPWSLRTSRKVWREESRWTWGAGSCAIFMRISSAIKSIPQIVLLFIQEWLRLSTLFCGYIRSLSENSAARFICATATGVDEIYRNNILRMQLHTQVVTNYLSYVSLLYKQFIAEFFL